jgi:hypothetical protein
MDRRQALAVITAGVAGSTAGSTVAHAADHPRDGAGPNPLNQMHLYLCAFHLAKRNPKIVIEAHHFCMPVNEDVHQCVILDTADRNARILGIEYIISDRVYRKLPKDEKKYYHPHSYEVTSGLLVAPRIGVPEENKLMENLVTTWGKTWHTWPDPTTPLPMGEPLLMWAATRDGQISEQALDQRDKRLKISTREVRKRRAPIGPVPQVDPPKSIDDIGRQWTNDGPDVPRRP